MKRLAFASSHRWFAPFARWPSLTLTLLALWFASGCQLFGGLHVQPVALSANPPGQVAVYTMVADGDRPVGNLQVENFSVYEDGKQLAPEAVGLRLLDRNPVALHHVLVLVDLSGPIAQPGRRELIARELTPFVERLRAGHDVSVYGFDGGQALYPFGKFPRNDGADTTAQVAAQLRALHSHQQKDPSSNLHGAVLAGLAQLDYHLRQSPKKLRLGTLVVLAQGPDLAGRTDENRIEEVLGQTDHHLYSLVASKPTNEDLAEEFGRSGHVTASSFDTMESSLAALATLVENDLKHYYLVSYCSPARAGKRTLLLEVSRPQAGGSADTSTAELEFEAAGFSSQCDSGSVPRFQGLLTSKDKSKAASGGVSTKAPAEPTPAEPPAAPETDPASDPAATETPGEPTPVAPPPPGSGYAN